MKIIDLTGREFGRLTVIRRAGSKNNKPAWLCRCSCDNTKVIAGSSLRSGLTTSCGCYRSESISSRRRKDLTNKKFGRLTVLSLNHVGEDSKIYWLCKCICGQTKVVASASLISGRTTSCGCYHKDVVSTMFKGRSDFKGENNPNYKFDKTDAERMDDRSYLGYKEWRNLVFERDNYSCIICGNGGAIQAHHIEDYSSNPELRTDVRNGACLCKKHHKLFHRIYGIKTNNINQFKEFLNGGN